MIDFINKSFTLLFIFPVIIIFGGYLSVKLKFVQIFGIKKAFSLLTTKDHKGSISSFSALSAILGGNLGTGNISGVAVALSMGGPGALFWMWVMAIFASITKYVGCFLGVHYQRQNVAKEWVGGPMYYLQDGLKSKILAQLFCFFCITSALTVGNLVQVHSLFVPLNTIDIHPLLFGIPLSLLVGAVIFGGMKRLAKVLSAVVPFMACVYLSACLIVLFIFRSELLPSLKLIFTSAFSMGSASSGLAGFSVLQAIRVGFNRGLFATDSGLGLAPILHSAVRDTNPKIDNRHVQGLISILSPMIVMVVCSMTGLVLLSTKVYENSSLPSTALCMQAFIKAFGHPLSGHIITVTLFFFAFTTILTWSFCADKAIDYLFGIKAIKPFQIFFILIIPIGAFVQDQFIWTFADISINFMFAINIIGIIGLSKMVIKARQIK